MIWGKMDFLSDLEKSINQLLAFIGKVDTSEASWGVLLPQIYMALTVTHPSSSALPLSA